MRNPRPFLQYLYCFTLLNSKLRAWSSHLSSEKFTAKVSNPRTFRRHQLCDQPAADWRGGGRELRRPHQEYRASTCTSRNLRWVDDEISFFCKRGKCCFLNVRCVQVVPKATPEMPQRFRTSRSLKGTSATASLFPSTWCFPGCSPAPRWRPPTSKSVSKTSHSASSTLWFCIIFSIHSLRSASIYWWYSGWGLDKSSCQAQFVNFQRKTK